MVRTRNAALVLSSLLIACLVFSFAMAADAPQPAAPGADRQGQGRGQGNASSRGGMDFQARMLEMAKTELAATDAEWAKIEPLLTKVFKLSSDASSRGMFGGRGRGGASADAAPAPDQTEVQKASAALRAVLQKTDSASGEIKAKLAEFRTAKEKAQKELAAAQAELKKAVTERQEAALVLMGTLN